MFDEQVPHWAHDSTDRVSLSRPGLPTFQAAADERREDELPIDRTFQASLSRFRISTCARSKRANPAVTLRRDLRRFRHGRQAPYARRLHRDGEVRPHAIRLGASYPDAVVGNEITVTIQLEAIASPA